MILFSCSNLRYQRQTDRQLPSLGTIGVFEGYALEDKIQIKTQVQIEEPIALSLSKVHIKKRTIFENADTEMAGDSTHYLFDIADQRKLIDQLNGDKNLQAYLANGGNFSIVTSIEMILTAEDLINLKKAHTYYLIQNDLGELQIDLKADNKLIGKINSTAGEITNFKALDFCWGASKGTRIEIMDLVSDSESCNADTYKSYLKAKNKNNLGF